MVACVHTGMQEECFQTILDAGPSGLLLPAPLYKLCRQAGIKPLLADVMTSPASPKAVSISLSLSIIIIMRIL